MNNSFLGFMQSEHLLEYADIPEDQKYTAKYEIGFSMFLDMQTDWETYWKHVKEQLRYDVFEKISPVIFSGTPVVIKAIYTTYDREDCYRKVIRLDIDLVKVMQMKVVMPIYEPIKVSDLYAKSPEVNVSKVNVLCAACGNIFIASSRGACSSCGAPAVWTL